MATDLKCGEWVSYYTRNRGARGSMRVFAIVQSVSADGLHARVRRRDFSGPVQTVETSRLERCDIDEECNRVVR